MRITIIGTGNVATVIGRLLIQNNHEVVSVVGRNADKTSWLANMLNATPVDILSYKPSPQTELYILAVSDAALHDSISGLAFEGIPVVHTAGSVSKDILQPIALNYGVLYPLQSLHKEMLTIPEIPFLVDANSDALMKMLLSFAGTLSKKVNQAGDTDRLKLHVAAVIVNNFSNHLFALADEFCRKENVPFEFLKPLIKETSHRIETSMPKDVQTGPAIRKDITTMDKHLRILNAHPKLRTMYLRMTDSIMNP